MLPKVIYIMGPPGAGKGTQAELLAKEISYVRFSTGDAFREVSRQDTVLGRRVKETIDNGFLAPPSMAAEIVITAVKKYLDQDQGLIFDGTPRTVEEAEIVDDFFANSQYGQPLVIYLTVDKDEMVKRNSKRLFCLDISGDFPVVTEQDRQKCASAGGRVGVRPDDEPAKFTTRWKQFMELTYPVVENYRQRGMVNELDGMPNVTNVHKNVMSVIKSFWIELYYIFYI